MMGRRNYWLCYLCYHCYSFACGPADWKSLCLKTPRFISTENWKLNSAKYNIHTKTNLTSEVTLISKLPIIPTLVLFHIATQSEVWNLRGPYTYFVFQALWYNIPAETVKIISTLHKSISLLIMTKRVILVVICSHLIIIQYNMFWTFPGAQKKYLVIWVKNCGNLWLCYHCYPHVILVVICSH